MFGGACSTDRTGEGSFRGDELLDRSGWPIQCSKAVASVFGLTLFAISNARNFAWKHLRLGEENDRILDALAQGFPATRAGGQNNQRECRLDLAAVWLGLVRAFDIVVAVLVFRHNGKIGLGRIELVRGQDAEAEPAGYHAPEAAADAVEHPRVESQIAQLGAPRE